LLCYYEEDSFFNLPDFVRRHNIGKIFLDIFLPAGRGWKNRSALAVTRKEASTFMIDTHKTLSTIGIKVYPVESMMVGESMRYTPMDCDSYKNHYMVTTDGTIGSCEIRNFGCRKGVFGNIFTDSAADIIGSQGMRMFLSKMATYGKECLSCSYILKCMGGCRCAEVLLKGDGECHGFKAIFDYIDQSKQLWVNHPHT
jgi:radical SAM protein with 4Fe4S-binding SPASM domain